MPDETPPESRELQHLTAYLADHDLPCPRCGYSLRHLTAGRCPECGDALRLQIALVEPRLAAYITLLTACASGFGGSALFGSVVFLCGGGNWWYQPCAIVLMLQLAVSIVAFVTVLAARRRLRRLRVGWQWLLAVTAWILFLTLSVVFVALLRR